MSSCALPNRIYEGIKTNMTTQAELQGYDINMPNVQTMIEERAKNLYDKMYRGISDQNISMAPGYEKVDFTKEPLMIKNYMYVTLENGSMVKIDEIPESKKEGIEESKHVITFTSSVKDNIIAFIDSKIAYLRGNDPEALLRLRGLKSKIIKQEGNFVYKEVDVHVKSIIALTTSAMNDKELLSKLSYQEMDANKHMLELYDALVDYALEYYNDNPDLVRGLTGLRNRISQAKQGIDAVIVETFKNENAGFISEEMFEAMAEEGIQDVSTIYSYTSGANFTRSPLIRALWNRIAQVKSALAIRLDQVEKRIESLKKQMPNLNDLIERDSSGKPTGYLVSDRNWAQFHEDVGAILEKNPNQWTKEEVIQIAEAIDLNHPDAQKILKRLQDKFETALDSAVTDLAEVRFGGNVSEVELLIEEYRKRIKEYKYTPLDKLFEEMKASGAFSNPKIKVLPQEFNNLERLLYSSPESIAKVIKRVQNGDRSDKAIKIFKSMFKKDLIPIVPSQKYENTQHVNRMKNDIQYRQAYEQVMEIMHEIRSKIPPVIREDGTIERYQRLPAFQKDLITRIQASGMGNFKDLFMDEFKRAFMEQKDYHSHEANFVYDVPQNVPFYGFGRTETESTDLGALLQLGLSMAETHDVKNQHRSYFESAKVFLKNSDKKVKVGGVEKRVAGSVPQNLLSMVEHFTNVLIYDNAYDPTNINIRIKEPTNPKYKEAIEKIDKKIEQYKKIYDKLNDPKITMDEYEEIVNAITAKNSGLGLSPFKINEQIKTKIRELEKRKTTLKNVYSDSVSLDKVGNTLLNYVSIQALAGNYISAIGEATFGFTSNIIRMILNGSNAKDIMRSFSKASELKMLAQSGDQRLSTLYKLFDLGYDMRYQIKDTKNMLHNKYLNTGNLFILNKIADDFNKYPLLVNELLQYKIVQNGKEFTVLDALLPDGSWDEKNFGPSIFQEGNPHYERLYELIHDSVLRSHGNYMPENAPRYNRYLLGRMVGQFKRWMPAALQNRFGTSIDLRSGEEMRGYWIVGAKTMLGLNKTGKGEDMTWAQRFTSYWGSFFYLTENYLEGNEKRAARAFAFEFLVTALMTNIAVGMLKALSEGGDDDDETSAYIKFAIGVLNRVENDATWFVEPTSYMSLGKNVFPSIRLLKDVMDVFNATTHYITGSDKAYYKSGPAKGDLKLFREFGDLIPIYKQIHTTQNFLYKAMRDD